jgi:hypothetical protein
MPPVKVQVQVLAGAVHGLPVPRLLIALKSISRILASVAVDVRRRLVGPNLVARHREIDAVLPVGFYGGVDVNLRASAPSLSGTVPKSGQPRQSRHRPTPVYLL